MAKYNDENLNEGSMQEIFIPDMKQVIRHVCCELREPAFFWAPPGVGKTEGSRQEIIALDAELREGSWQVPWMQELKLNGAILADVRANEYEPCDIRGMPNTIKIDSLRMTAWDMPSTLPVMDDNGNCNPKFPKDKLICLFWDEANAAEQSTSAVLMKGFNERKFGDCPLMPNVVMWAAGNREGDRCVAQRQPLALSNRFTHYSIGVSVEAWCEEMMGQINPIAIGFHKFRKPLLMQFDPDSPNKAFSTPRTCKKMWRYYDSDMPMRIKRASMEGVVGTGCALEAWAFVEIWQHLPKMSAIIKNPKGVELPKDPKTGKEWLAMKYAVSVAVSGEMNTQNIGPLDMFLRRFDPEFNIMAWQLASKRDKTLCHTDEFMKFANDFGAAFAI